MRFEECRRLADDLQKQGELIMQKISMIILAGGASRRMGCDKSDLMIDGKNKTKTKKKTTWRSGSMLAQGRDPTLSGACC